MNLSAIRAFHATTAPDCPANLEQIANLHRYATASHEHVKELLAFIDQLAETEPARKLLGKAFDANVSMERPLVRDVEL